MKRREFISLVAGALVRSRAAPAQQPTKVYRIAIVHPSRPVSQMTETDPYWRPLFQELRLLGYVEGQNLVVERYSGEGREQNYARLAHEVVHLKPDLIFANSDRMMGHFKAATTTIPIVGLMADPVSSGLVAGLANRGGNITGSRRWLRDLDQAARNAPSGYPKPNDSGLPRFPWGVGRPGGIRMREAAQQLGISLIGPSLEVLQEAEYRRVFAAMKEERADAILVHDQPENTANMRLISELSEKSRLPASCPYREYLEGGVSGGLMSYGVFSADLFRRAAP